ncbi:MAG TPA: APC family permease [Anaerolineaceae bacterium]
MLNKIRYWIVGSPLPSDMMAEKRLNKVRALAAFSPDALSSVAYANQEIYLGLVAAGAAGLALSFPIALAITILLVIVALSYAQTIRGYPSGGGSYIVARANLGTLPGLIAAAALMLDYVLTAAVSLTAGVAEIASAFPVLYAYRIWLALALLVLIMLLNLRGQRESGTAMAVPVYLFLVTFIGMEILGFARLLINHTPPVPIAQVAPQPLQALTLILVLHAFSAGCTALTGIEAISNGVPAFKAPAATNARMTLGIMAALMVVLFAGSMGLTQYLGVIAGPNETILSALARRLLGVGAAYYVVQISTLAILAVAANTSFADFPRLAAILSSDKFLPRQLFNLGDRLVYTNGIVLLAGLAGVLIVVFNGNEHALVPLFAVGAFSAFTLSQSGMVVHWYKEHSPGWHLKLFINGLGALVTGSTVLVIGASKFLEGAWISVLVIPLVVVLFLRIRGHYRVVSAQLTLKGLPPSLRPMARPRVVIPVSGVHRAMVQAVTFARAISDHVTAVYIDIDPEPDEVALRRQWEDWFPDVKLEIIPSPYRSIVEPLLQFLEDTDHAHNDGSLAVLLLPEIIPASPWNGMLHNQTAALIKDALLYKRYHTGLNRVIIDVPYHLSEHPLGQYPPPSQES